MSVRDFSLFIGIRHRVCLCMSKSSQGSVGVEKINTCILCVYHHVFAFGVLVWLHNPSPAEAHGHQCNQSAPLPEKKGNEKLAHRGPRSLNI